MSEPLKMTHEVRWTVFSSGPYANGGKPMVEKFLSEEDSSTFMVKLVEAARTLEQEFYRYPEIRKLK